MQTFYNTEAAYFEAKYNSLKKKPPYCTRIGKPRFYLNDLLYIPPEKNTKNPKYRFTLIYNCYQAT